MQLLLDPLIDAHCGNPINLAGPWAERQTVEGMLRALVLVCLWDQLLLFLRKDGGPVT
jgi:hypothetical protein